MHLSDAEYKKEYIIEEINGQGIYVRRFYEMGILPMAKIKLLKKAPFGDPYIIGIRGYKIAVRKIDCGKIVIMEV